MPVWLGSVVRAQQKCAEKKPEADYASHCRNFKNSSNLSCDRQIGSSGWLTCIG